MRPAAPAAGARSELANGNRSIQRSWSKSRMIISPVGVFGMERKSCAGAPTKRHANVPWIRLSIAKGNLWRCCELEGRGPSRLLLPDYATLRERRYSNQRDQLGSVIFP